MTTFGGKARNGDDRFGRNMDFSFASQGWRSWILGVVYKRHSMVRMGTETAMTKNAAAAVSHHTVEIEDLRADRDLAVEYLKAAMESLDNPDDRAAGLLALRTVAEAYGGLAAVAREAGISREALYRSLSPSGNPTLKTLLAVLGTVGIRLSVERARKRS